MLAPLRDCLAAAENELQRRLGDVTPIAMIQSRFGWDCLEELDGIHVLDDWPADECAGLQRLPGLSRGRLQLLDWNSSAVLAFEWERLPSDLVPAPVEASMVWLAARLNVSRVLHVTAGMGLQADVECPSVQWVGDHVRWDGEDPLAGWPAEREGARFPQMERAYDSDWGARLLPEATARVAWVRGGPSGPTAAEVAVCARMGGELLVESGAVEAIAARHCGRRFASLVLVLERAGEQPRPDPGLLADRATRGLHDMAQTLLRGLDWDAAGNEA